MQLKFSSKLPNRWRKYCVPFLAFSLTFGFSMGIYLARTMQDSMFSLMRAVAFSRVSIVGLFVLLFLPLLLSAAAVYFSIPAMVLPLSFCKGFCMGYCALGILFVFGSASWLVRLLLMFSDCFMILPLSWFWIRHISGCRNMLRRDFLICSAIAIVIGIVDYFLVSPFLVMLMNYS